jgi:fumarate reductase (CoM/CoB) subunit B
MGHDLELTKALSKCCEECIQCNSCVEACDLLGACGLNLGEIAARLLAGNDSQEMRDLIQRCDLCGFCTRDCPSTLNAGDLFKYARELLVEQSKLSLDGFELMFIDRDWNAFSLYRDTYKVNYDDLKRDHYDTLFFPGCSLATYAPELTRAAHGWLESRGMVLGFTDSCCGKPLESLGLEGRKEQLQRYLLSQLKAAGATRIVTVCANCHANLAGGLEGIEIVSLYQLLREAGVRVPGTESLTVHDSCADREIGVLGADLRAILGDHPVLEMEHSGKNTICCGAGGIVPAIDPELCSSRARRRVDEFEKSGAECMVTSCMACSRRLSPLARKGQVRHCLELLFDIELDYEQMKSNQDAMWEGEWGEFNRDRLEKAKPFTQEDRNV